MRRPTPLTLDTQPTVHADASPGDLHDHSVPTGTGVDEILLPLAQEDPLATIRDDVDEQVLPIFLDEAAELFPQAGEELRAWRRNPHDAKPVTELRRTLHTLKGSARMAGAMRLGELTHLMESHLGQGDVPSATPEFFETLETSLDRIAFVLDRLRSGETNTRLPWVAEAPDEAPVAAAAPEIVAPRPIAGGPIGGRPARAGVVGVARHSRWRRRLRQRRW